MIVGVPKEIMEQEHRVSLVPSGVKLLTDDGHQVLVEVQRRPHRPLDELL